MELTKGGKGQSLWTLTTHWALHSTLHSTSPLTTHRSDIQTPTATQELIEGGKKTKEAKDAKVGYDHMMKSLATTPLELEKLYSSVLVMETYKRLTTGEACHVIATSCHVTST